MTLPGKGNAAMGSSPSKSEETAFAAEIPQYTNHGDDDETSTIQTHHPGFTTADRTDMRRMGKTQSLLRTFPSLPILSFAIVLQSTWEFLLISITQGLIDGGLAGLFWSYIWTFLGFLPIIASIAEMASMAPTSGGQYHWVSEFAPRRYQRFLSYFTGWQATLAWQSATASGSFLSGTIIQGLVSVNYPDYEATRWQGTLLVFAMVLVLLGANIWGWRALPTAQHLALVFHLTLFLAIVVCFWALAPTHQPARTVFTQFYNGGGWATGGLSVMVGQISAIYGSLSSDAAAHLSEEVSGAGLSVPRAIFWSYTINGALGFVFLVSFLFAIDDVEAAIGDPSGYPFLYVFGRMERLGRGGVSGLTGAFLGLLTVSNVNFNAAAARQLFAFGRDGGLVFGGWISKVHPTRHIPTNAILLTGALTALLSLINIGSTAAFNAIISLSTVSLMLTYALSIGCVLHRRLTDPRSLPRARWSLGRWGVGVNVAGLGYSIFAFFWCFWPNSTPVTREDFNWSVVIFVAVVVVSLGLYVGRVRRGGGYQGPVVLVRGG